MKYSVIIPIYERLEIFDLVLDSVLKQTFQPFEIIIVDNNINHLITNNLLKVISFFKKKVSFEVHYLKSPINSGSIARNLGALKAKGELVAFLDSDVVLDKDYYEKLIKYFVNEKNIIGIQGLDKSLIEKNNGPTQIKFFNKFIYFIEQFFETSALYNQNKCYVSPSLAVSHPNVNKEFEIDSQWISTCAGIFKKSLFKKYFFPKGFVTYSNNEYLMFSYQLYKNKEGRMIYTSKAKYRDLQTKSGRIKKIELMYQIEAYDLYIFIRLFNLDLKNIFIFLKSRIGHLIYYFGSSILRKEISLKTYWHSIKSIIYPFINISSIIKGDLSFYENDFPIK